MYLNNWLALIEANIVMEEYEIAIKESLLALIHFNRSEIYYQLSCCYFHLGDEKLGNEAFHKALELDKTKKEEFLEK